MNNKTNLALKTWTKLARAFSTLSKLDTDHIRLFWFNTVPIWSY